MIFFFAVIGALTCFAAAVIAIGFLRFWLLSKKATVRTEIPKAWLHGIADGRRRP